MTEFANRNLSDNFVSIRGNKVAKATTISTI